MTEEEIVRELLKAAQKIAHEVLGKAVSDATVIAVFERLCVERDLIRQAQEPLKH